MTIQKNKWTCPKKYVKSNKPKEKHIGKNHNQIKGNRKKTEEKKPGKKHSKIRQAKIIELIPQQRIFESITKVTLPKEPENLRCKKTPKNILLNMPTG